MRLSLLTLLLAAAPTLAAAQETRVDGAQIRACFADTPEGAFYPDCLGKAANTCQDAPGGRSTIGIAECIEAETAMWDQILNEEYKAAMAVLATADDAGRSPILDRTDALREAQRAWITFRDADCTAHYARWQEGTIRTIVGANCHLTMTAQRALELRSFRGE